MCKTIFIATKDPLSEIPFNETNPNFSLEIITDEFLPIKNKFSNQNIYIAYTSRGCGCDFGVSIIPDLAGYLEKEKQRMYPIDKMKEKFRSIMGRQEAWYKKHIVKVQGQIEDEKFYLEQTYKLINLIKDNVTLTSNVELFCCWAGDYEAATDDTKFISTDDKEFFNSFDIELNEKIVFGGQKASS